MGFFQRMVEGFLENEIKACLPCLESELLCATGFDCMMLFWDGFPSTFFRRAMLNAGPYRSQARLQIIWV